MQTPSAPHADLRTRVARPCDPPALAVHLARSGLVREYLVYEQNGRWSFADGIRGSVTVTQDEVRTTWNGDGGPAGTVTPLGAGHPAHALGKATRSLPAEEWQAYGWVAFESALAPEHRAARATAGQPLAYLFVPRLDVTIDAHGAEVRCSDRELLDRAVAVLEAGAAAALPTPRTRPLDVECEGPEAYERAVAEAVRRIRGGELEKVILSRSVEVPFALDFPATYLAGRRANTPARSFLLELPGGLRAAGFSPETVAEISADGRVTSQPLAGTRARHQESAQDLRSAAELSTDPKEIYEHAVSVKLADSELRALCVPGTVGVSEFMVTKERGSVRHLGSRVHGQLPAGRTPWDALVALFPAVTASGIPKTAAYEVITALEPEPRGLYSGAVLRATSSGELDATLALRTVCTHHGRPRLRAGAGIVAASLPAREYRETCEKLASVAPYLVPAPEPRA
jgi:salicylate synthase